jgi:hypothetical protein
MKLARVKIHEQICSRSGQLLSATERLLCCVRAGHKEPERKNCTIRSREGVCQCQFYWSYPFASAARVDALEKHEVRADGRLIGANFPSDCFFHTRTMLCAQAQRQRAAREAAAQWQLGS